MSQLTIVKTRVKPLARELIGECRVEARALNRLDCMATGTSRADTALTRQVPPVLVISPPNPAVSFISFAC